MDPPRTAGGRMSIPAEPGWAAGILVFGVATVVSLAVVAGTPGEHLDREVVAAAQRARTPGMLLDRRAGGPDAPPHLRDVPQAPPAPSDTRLDARPRLPDATLRG